jgi:type III restriction enzyme
VIVPEQPLLSQDFLRDIAHATGRNLGLDGHFSGLYRIVKGYVQQRCFGVAVDLDSEDIKRRLRDPLLQEGIATFLSQRIADLATQERAIEFEDAAFRLSQTQPFTWRRLHITCDKTIFNECAVYNDLEAGFARFLAGAPDIIRFAALAESYTRFRVDYMSSSGAIKFYYPDFVAVQATPTGEVNWIVETKGREWDDVAQKDASMRDWCEKITAQTGQPWRYLKVPQREFDSSSAHTLGELVEKLEGREPRLIG